MASRPGFCTVCGDKRTKQPSGICQPCERAENPPERRWRACLVCGETTTSKKGTHPACRLAAPATATATDALPDGDWRFDPFRRVQIYVPRPVPDPAAKPRDPNATYCKGCDKAFEPANGRHKYCTLQCRKRADWARRGARVNPRRREQRARAREQLAEQEAA